MPPSTSLSHSLAIGADRWPDDLRLSDIEPRFVCRACGKRGADVRPDFQLGQAAREDDGLSIKQARAGGTSAYGARLSPKKPDRATRPIRLPQPLIICVTAVSGGPIAPDERGQSADVYRSVRAHLVVRASAVDQESRPALLGRGSVSFWTRRLTYGSYWLILLFND